MAPVKFNLNQPIRPAGQSAEKKRPLSHSKPGAEHFQQILDDQIRQKSVVFSKHAAERLLQRNIKLTPQEMTRINAGLEQAAQKGIRETLIMMDNRAFIASVSSRTVITAAVDEQLKESVFTNIDGAVIV
jgi:flagellar operon protein